jgi:lipopolysaccharide export system permease protein
MAGLSRKKLLLPFFFFATILSTFGYLNHEYFSGKAISAADQFKTIHSKTKKKHRCSKDRVQSLILEDQSELIYQHFDGEKKELFDVFWIRSDQDLWYMKIFSFATNPPIGYFADHMIREQLLQKQESFEKKIFDEFPSQQTITHKPFIPFESRPLSTLFRDSHTTTAEGPSIKIHLHYKLALPLLPLLFLLIAAPFGFMFSRKNPFFLIVSLSLFGFIICRTLFDSLLILGENKVLPPVPAMWFCPLLIIALSLRRFARL